MDKILKNINYQTYKRKAQNQKNIYMLLYAHIHTAEFLEDDLKKREVKELR